MKKYKQLSLEQRYKIEALLKAGIKKIKIAEQLNIARSTLYREIKHNSTKRGLYRAKYADMLYNERKERFKRERTLTQNMKKLIVCKLTQEQWSPEQIKGWCDINQIPMVSHETIYQFIYQDKSSGGNLYVHLRCQNKKYKKRYHNKENRGRIPDKVPIEQRPEQVEQKQRIGDFEIDLIIGHQHQGVVLTIVDRMTGFTLIETLLSKKSSEVSKAIINTLALLKQL